MSDQRAKGCFKVGCFGCLGVAAVAVGAVVLLGILQATVDTEHRPEKREVVHELPGTPATDRPSLPEALRLPPQVPPTPGRIVLDLRMGEFTITPGPPDQPIRVTADYDAGSFELEETFTPAQGDAGWRYELRFGGRGGLLGLLLHGDDEAHNRIELTIPRGHPLELTGSIGMGKSESDLTGLDLRQVDLDLGMGEHYLELREPSPAPMGSFRVDSSMGSVEIRGLGNASPRTVEVSHGMGEILLDLDGPWRGDATVDLDFSLGESRLWLPRNARIKVDRANVALGESRVDELRNEDLPADAPTLQLNLRGSLGELRVER